jgi:dolichol kinase
MAMNKFIFQLGALAFFVSSVIFSLQRLSVLETVSRSFIVFVGVVVIAALALGAMSLIASKTNAQSQRLAESKASPGEYTNAGKQQMQAAPQPSKT